MKQIAKGDLVSIRWWPDSGVWRVASIKNDGLSSHNENTAVGIQHTIPAPDGYASRWIPLGDLIEPDYTYRPTKMQPSQDYTGRFIFSMLDEDKVYGWKPQVPRLVVKGWH